MNKSEREREDQRVNSGMEDSNMTIEFLRARLLSERTVSKCARERADELADRVAELEEELRIVSFQRMKAEKATADVLAILGDNGVTDVSETVDSNSDQDISFEEEQHANSRVQHDSEFSGSEPSPGKSLSWKGRKDNAHSAERCKGPFYRRRNNIAFVCPSPRHRTGKSCRQVRRKESRYMAEDPKTNATRAEPPAKETSTAIKVRMIDDGDQTAGAFEDRAGQILSQVPTSGHTETEANASSSDLDNSVQGMGADMEQAIKNRAQLIDRYEAMERAQSEWEEKFRENNNSNPDSCDPGNRSDITEERYEMKEEAPLTPGTTGTHVVGPNAEANASSNFHQNGESHSSVYLGESNERKSSNVPAYGPLKEGFSFPLQKEKENVETSRTDLNSRPDNGNHSLHSPNWQDLPASQSAPTFPPTTHASLRKEAVPVGESYASVPRKGSEKVGGVLEALEQAKQSLRQKIKGVPLVEGGALVPALPSSTLRNTVSYPVGPIGLFRLPTDFAVGDNIQVLVPISANRLTLGSRYPDTAISASVNGRLVGRPYTETGSTGTYADHIPSMQYQVQQLASTQIPYHDPPIYRRAHSTRPHISSDDQSINAPNPYLARPARSLLFPGGYVQPGAEFSSGRYAEFGSGFAPRRPPSDPYIDTGLLTSTRYTYPSPTMNASSHNPMYLTPPGEALSSSLPGRSFGVPPGNLPFNNGTTPDMYRY